MFGRDTTQVGVSRYPADLTPGLWLGEGRSYDRAGLVDIEVPRFLLKLNPGLVCRRFMVGARPSKLLMAACFLSGDRDVGQRHFGINHCSWSVTEQVADCVPSRGLPRWVFRRASIRMCIFGVCIEEQTRWALAASSVAEISLAEKRSAAQ